MTYEQQYHAALARIAELEADRDRLDWLLGGEHGCDEVDIVLKGDDHIWHPVTTREQVDAARAKKTTP